MKNKLFILLAFILVVGCKQKEHHTYTNDIFTSYEEKNILAQGELISTTMMTNYLTEQNIKAENTASAISSLAIPAAKVKKSPSKSKTKNPPV